ncbi:hypothetical protein [Chitinophaga sp.]|uniref:hypothetical protein n=1 Tax=Chitinophaga sp. TaxID=1869181 RepID=UPI0031D2B841
MYEVRPSLTLGFHGCDAAVRDTLLLDPDNIKISKAPFDWLGTGMYFWENNYYRALLWAKEKMKRGHIKQPAVLGAVLDLGHCCDLLDSQHILALKKAYQRMATIYSYSGIDLPQNKDLPHDQHNGKILRELDCAAIEYMHSYIRLKQQTQQSGATSKLYDSTRNVFIEGGPVFHGSGIYEKSHIQICVRNANCIKGFFMPRREVEFAG